MFDNRRDAADRLAAALRSYRGQRPLVLGIPRGAVPMARRIADALDGEVDVVLVRKLPAPGNPEFAIGAIEESGWAFVSADAARVGASEADLEREKAHQLDLIRERRSRYTADRPRIDPHGRQVIVVDDGLATGSTMIAALHAIRVQQPERLVCAAPVAPPDALKRVRPYADEVVCLETHQEFAAVSQFYRSFPQVDDAEVLAALKR